MIVSVSCKNDRGNEEKISEESTAVMTESLSTEEMTDFTETEETMASTQETTDSVDTEDKDTGFNEPIELPMVP